MSDETLKSRFYRWWLGSWTFVKWLAEHAADEKDRRTKELQDHPLIGRVFKAKSNSDHKRDEEWPRSHEYKVASYDAKSGKYIVHAHGEFACLTPGAWDEQLLYSADEIEKAT